MRKSVPQWLYATAPDEASPAQIAMPIGLGTGGKAPKKGNAKVGRHAVVVRHDHPWKASYGAAVRAKKAKEAEAKRLAADWGTRSHGR